MRDPEDRYRQAEDVLRTLDVLNDVIERARVVRLICLMVGSAEATIEAESADGRGPERAGDKTGGCGALDTAA